MQLTLRVQLHHGNSPIDSNECVFQTFPVIVGRAGSCDYCLDDPSRYISSRHAIIEHEGHQLLIHDTSANGVYINGAIEGVGRGNKVVLNHADSIAIGDYTLVALIEHAAVAPTGSHITSDPFDILAPDTPQQPVPAAVDLDPFRGDEPDWTPRSAQSGNVSVDAWDTNTTPDAGNANVSTGSGDDDWSDWPDFGEQSARASRSAAPVSSSPSVDEFDWLPGSTDNTKPVQTPPTPGRDAHAGGAKRGYRQPGLTPQQPPAPQRNPQRPASDSAGPVRQSQSASAPSSALADLLHGASLRETDFHGIDDRQILEQTGRLLMQMVEAIMVLLESRAELKNAIRSDMTRLSRRDNNPLKFSVNTSDALTRLLTNADNGYLSSDQAIQEAVDDLKMHQLAMLDGMKSAVRSLLLEFDPDKLAKTLESTGGLSASIPITRDAKLWSLFCEHYDAISEEAVNDFTDLFGAEFRKAYEKRIRNSGRPPDF